jgi:hypothetical protein
VVGKECRMGCLLTVELRSATSLSVLAVVHIYIVRFLEMKICDFFIC